VWRDYSRDAKILDAGKIALVTGTTNPTINQSEALTWSKP